MPASTSKPKTNTQLKRSPSALASAAITPAIAALKSSWAWLCTWKNFTLTAIQDEFLLWCYHHYKVYPRLFACMSVGVTFSTGVGFFYLCRIIYNATTFAGKYWFSKSKSILLNDKPLYKRYGNPQKKEEGAQVDGQQRSWAVVTGGTEGYESLGYQISKRLAREGFNICMIGRDKTKLKTVLQYLGSNEIKNPEFKAKFIEADFSEISTLQEYKSRIANQLINLELDIGIVVINAGFCQPGPFADITPEQVDSQIRVNALQPLFLVRALKDILIGRQNPSAVLIVSSLFGVKPVPGFLAYSASKAFASTLGQGLSYELEGLNVDVLTYLPGLIKSKHLKGTELDSLPLLSVLPSTAANAALTELEMSPYGASCGTNIQHEATEYLANHFLPSLGIFNYLMFRYGQKGYAYQITEQKQDLKE